MSGIADSPNFAHLGPHVPFGPLRFSERLARENEGERAERAASDRVALVPADDRCSRACRVAAIRDEFAPRLAEVSPVPQDGGTKPPREAPQITIQQLLPIGSIIDVTV